ncbi:MAG: fimbrial assembly protein [Bdellovibrio sp.]|nr:MAG: fimbrial assembly protein [Bdellovibrio sp.]
MIRINLATSAGRAKKKGISPDAAFEEELRGLGGGDESAQTRNLVVRAVILLIGPVVLFIYSDAIVPEKYANLRRLEAEHNEVSKKNRDAAAAVEEIKKFEKEEQKLQAQINALNSIKKDRMREVRVLDYIQRTIPPKVWLKKLELSTEGRVVLGGLTNLDSELTAFMDSLQKSAYLKDVSLVRSNEVSTKEEGVLKTFEITCNLEKTQ